MFCNADFLSDQEEEAIPYKAAEKYRGMTRVFSEI